MKLVGDWISRDEGDLAPSFPAEAFAEAIAVAHEHGAKVTAHCFGHDVLPGLIAAGIDCIEHGTGLTEDLIESMAAQGVALVPTVMQLDKFPGYAEAGRAKFPEYSATMTDLYARRRDTIMAAHDAGVALYAGTDGGGVARHGNLAGEVIAMAELGMSAEYALGAASWRARGWLGGTPGWGRATPPTSSCSTPTRWRTWVCCTGLRGWCCGGGWWPEEPMPSGGSPPGDRRPTCPDSAGTRTWSWAASPSG